MSFKWQFDSIKQLERLCTLKHDINNYSPFLENVLKEKNIKAYICFHFQLVCLFVLVISKQRMPRIHSSIFQCILYLQIQHYLYCICMFFCIIACRDCDSSSSNNHWLAWLEICGEQDLTTAVLKGWHQSRKPQDWFFLPSPIPTLIPGGAVMNFFHAPSLRTGWSLCNWSCILSSRLSPTLQCAKLVYSIVLIILPYFNTQFMS